MEVFFLWTHWLFIVVISDLVRFVEDVQSLLYIHGFYGVVSAAFAFCSFSHYSLAFQSLATQRLVKYLS